MLLRIRLSNDITSFEEAEVSDALNETMRLLAADGLIDDSDEEGWSYDQAEQPAPQTLATARELLAALEAIHGPTAMGGMNRLIGGERHYGDTCGCEYRQLIKRARAEYDQAERHLCLASLGTHECRLLAGHDEGHDCLDDECTEEHGE